MGLIRAATSKGDAVAYPAGTFFEFRCSHRSSSTEERIPHSKQLANAALDLECGVFLGNFRSRLPQPGETGKQLTCFAHAPSDCSLSDCRPYLTQLRPHEHSFSRLRLGAFLKSIVDKCSPNWIPYVFTVFAALWQAPSPAPNPRFLPLLSIHQLRMGIRPQ